VDIKDFIEGEWEEVKLYNTKKHLPGRERKIPNAVVVCRAERNKRKEQLVQNEIEKGSNVLVQSDRRKGKWKEYKEWAKGKDGTEESTKTR